MIEESEKTKHSNLQNDLPLSIAAPVGISRYSRPNLQEMPSSKNVLVYHGTILDREGLVDILEKGFRYYDSVETFSNFGGLDSTPYKASTAGNRLGFIFEFSIPLNVLRNGWSSRQTGEQYYELRSSNVSQVIDKEEGSYQLFPSTIKGVWAVDNRGQQKKVYFLGSNSDEVLKNLNILEQSNIDIMSKNREAHYNQD